MTSVVRRIAAVLGFILFLGSSGSPAAALEIRADARVELMAAVQRAIGEKLREGPSLAAAKLADARIAPFSGHPAIASARKLRASGFSGDLALQFSFYLTTAPPLALASRPPSMFEDAAGGPGQLESFVHDLASLERASGFFAWFEGPNEAREALERDLAGAVGDAAGFEGGLVDYLGEKTWGRWVLVPSPSVGDGGEAEWVLERSTGLPDVSVVLGPRRDGAFPKGASLARAVWPEAVSSATYLLIERCRPALARLGGVCRAYGIDLPTADGCVQSLWISAIVPRAVGRAYGAAASTRMPGSPRSERVEAALVEFEAERKDNPTLLDQDLALWKAVGAAPEECPLVDGSRLETPFYRQRLARTLDLKLARRPTGSLWKARAELRAADGDLPGAEQDARSAASAEPGDAEAWLDLGVLLTRRGKLKESLEAFDRCAGAAPPGGLDPGLEADLWSSRGIAERDLGQRGKARASLKRALAVAPPDWERRADVQALIAGLEERIAP